MIGTKHYPFPTDFGEALALPDYQFKSLFGREIVESWHGLQQIEAFLRTHDIDYIFELGTGKGILTIYFAAWAWLHDKWVESYDLSDESAFIAPLKAALPFGLSQTDLLAADSRAITELRRVNFREHPPNRVMLYCDINAAVIRKYAPMLKPGDFLITHMWGHMVKPEEIQPLVDGGVLAFYRREVWEKTGPHMGFIRC